MTFERHVEARRGHSETISKSHTDPDLRRYAVGAARAWVSSSNLPGAGTVALSLRNSEPPPDPDRSPRG